MSLYAKIKKLVYEKGLTIYKIEKDLGLANGVVGKWDNQTPSASNLLKVARYLGTSVEDLLAE